MPARPGAFTANFAPETLNEFREKCKSSGLQYTKVLEELAVLFLKTKGEVLQLEWYAEQLYLKTEFLSAYQPLVFDFIKEKGLGKEFKKEVLEHPDLYKLEMEEEDMTTYYTEERIELKEKIKSTENWWRRPEQQQRYSPRQEKVENWEDGFTFQNSRLHDLKEFDEYNSRILMRLLQELNLQRLAVEEKEDQLQSIDNDPILRKGGQRKRAFDNKIYQFINDEG